MTTRIAVICGSLRKSSFTRAICDTLPELVDGQVEFVEMDYRDVPLYDEDMKADGSPAGVRAAAKMLDNVDAIVVASPEYNRGMSGVLKNFLDWMSKEPEAPLSGKAGLVITQSPGATGGLVANYNLRQVLSVCGVSLVPGFEVAVSSVMDKVDGGKLADQPTRDFIAANLAQLVDMADRQPAKAA